jgi:membrane-bound lytic murein transglycosylase D
MRRNLIFLMILFFLTGCATVGNLNWLPQNKKLLQENSLQKQQLDSLKTELADLTQVIDSLYYEIEYQRYTADSLREALEIANSRVAVNQQFVIPDSIEFAGRIFHLHNERIYHKFEKIFKNELNSAHRFIPRTGRYFALFDSVFAQYEVPLDAKYLAIAESRLSSLAYSRAGASGIWQFMKSTAEGYGMKVNSYVDERRNVYKATEAAAKFLKSNYQFLQRYGVNDWLLAMSAYNAGPGNIAKVIRQQGGKDFFDLMMKADETNKYVWKAVAAKLIIENEEEIFGKKLERQQPLDEIVRQEPIELKGYHKIDDWAQAQGTFVGKIWEFNPWIKIYQRSNGKYSSINDVVLPPGKFEILVPIASKQDNEKLAKIQKKLLQENSGYFTYHVVKKGDNLYNIARKYKTSVSKLKELNGLHSNIIIPGQKLKLFGQSSESYYVVKKGDSVSKIADKVGTSTTHLIKKNNLKSKNGVVMIYPGQKLYF